jgi:hypothetical protein
MKKNPAKQYDSYEVITQEDPETGDVIVPIPPQVLQELGWKEGDEIDIQLDEKGKITLKKLSK